MGFLLFSEALPLLWWAGAALLVAGSVIIGRREEPDPLTVGGGPIALGDDGLEADQSGTRGASDLESTGTENEELLMDVQPSGDEMKLGEDIDDPLK